MKVLQKKGLQEAVYALVRNKTKIRSLNTCGAFRRTSALTGYRWNTRSDHLQGGNVLCDRAKIGSNKASPIQEFVMREITKQADACASAEGRGSQTLLPEGGGSNVKIGDKITVPVKIVQIVINNGVHYVVVPVKGDNYNTMKITEKTLSNKGGGNGKNN
jgi:hypothetical protein